MPVYNEETFNYEILLRFGDTGPNKGKLTGASRTTITQTTKDGVPIGGGTNINPPEQLALIAGQEGEMLSTVLGEVSAATIVLNGQLQASLAEIDITVAHQSEQLTKLHNELESALADLDTALKTIADLRAQQADQDLPLAKSGNTEEA